MNPKIMSLWWDGRNTTWISSNSSPPAFKPINFLKGAVLEIDFSPVQNRQTKCAKAYFVAVVDITTKPLE